jgi:hypothetical protein
MGSGDSQDEDIELEGNGAQDIHEESWFFAYLQANEILVKMTPKEQNHVVHKAYKQFKWEGNSLLHVWIDVWIWIVLCLEQCVGLVQHVHEKLGHLGSNKQ